MQSRIAWKRRRRSSAGDIDAHRDVRLELHALGEHLFEPAVENALFELEIGDSVAKQSAEAVAPLEHHDVVPQPGQLLSGGEAGRPGTDDRHLLARLRLRAKRLNPALGEGPLDDPKLDVLDIHRLLS